MSGRILQLYNADPKGVVTSRVCPLPDLRSATVRREVNGEYSLTTALPRGAYGEDEIQLGRAIKATVNEAGKEQYFIIKRRSRSLNGDMQIYAEHQSYYYNGVVIRGGGASASASPQLSFRQLWMSAHPSIRDLATFTYSRVNAQNHMVPMISRPTTVRELLLHWLLETHGGELIFDGFDVEYVDQMGADNGAFYRWGVNLTDMGSEDILDGYASGIFPYWGSIDPRTNTGIVVSPSWTFDFPGTYPLEVYVPLDLTSKFDTQPSTQDLDAAAAEYVAQHASDGVPISISASRVRVEGDTAVDLGDTVRVVNTPWGVDQKTRIFALNFDALQGRVIDVQFGSVNPGFAGAVKNMI